MTEPVWPRTRFSCKESWLFCTDTRLFCGYVGLLRTNPGSVPTQDHMRVISSLLHHSDVSMYLKPIFRHPADCILPFLVRQTFRYTQFSGGWNWKLVYQKLASGNWNEIGTFWCFILWQNTFARYACIMSHACLKQIVQTMFDYVCPWAMCLLSNTRDYVSKSRDSNKYKRLCFIVSSTNTNLHGFELHRPSSKGTKLLLQVIKTIIIQFDTYSFLFDTRHIAHGRVMWHTHLTQIWWHWIQKTIWGGFS